MPRLGANEIAVAAYKAGITDPRTLAVATAIALGESGGNTHAHNSRGEDSRGLWQINVASHVRTPQSVGAANADALFDPNVNARAMYKISGGGKNWRPWTIYTRGTYRLHLPVATVAAGIVAAGGYLAHNDVPGEGVLDAAQAPIELAKTAVGRLQAINEWVSDRNNIFRMTLVAGGFVLVIASVASLVSTPVSGNVGKAVGLVAGKKLGKVS